MVLHDYRLSLFYMTIENSVKMCHFYFGGQGAKFQNVFGDGSIKATHYNFYFLKNCVLRCTTIN